MSEWELDATLRERTGKGVNRRLRLAGQVPAVIYGLHDPQTIQVPEREASRLVHQTHGISRMITLRLADKPNAKPTERVVLLKEVQTTPVGGKLLHIDFNEIDVSRTVRVNIEVRPVGLAEGVKMGGIMQMVLHEISVECLPSNIPEYVEAEVTELDIGHALHVSDLNFPPDVKPITDGGSAVIVIAGQIKEEVIEEEIEEGVDLELEEGEEGAVEVEEDTATEESTKEKS